jgi:hypothetical protein
MGRYLQLFGQHSASIWETLLGCLVFKDSLSCEVVKRRMYLFGFVRYCYRNRKWQIIPNRY